MNPSPYDRTVAFLRGRYRLEPVATIAMVASLLWAAWVIYYVLNHRDASEFGWFLLARTAVSEIGSGVLLAAGVVWLVRIVTGDRT